MDTKLYTIHVCLFVLLSAMLTDANILPRPATKDTDILWPKDTSDHGSSNVHKSRAKRFAMGQLLRTQLGAIDNDWDRIEQDWV